MNQTMGTRNWNSQYRIQELIHGLGLFTTPIGYINIMKYWQEILEEFDKVIIGWEQGQVDVIKYCAGARTETHYVGFLFLVDTITGEISVSDIPKF